MELKSELLYTTSFTASFEITYISYYISSSETLQLAINTILRLYYKNYQDYKNYYNDIKFKVYIIQAKLCKEVRRTKTILPTLIYMLHHTHTCMHICMNTNAYMHTYIVIHMYIYIEK